MTDLITPDQFRAALQAEYLHVQKTIEDFDGRALTIKAWSVTFGLVAIAGAFASHACTVFLVASLSAGLFWYLETIWKVFQLAYYQRSEDIEMHFRGEWVLLHSFQIGASWMDAWNAVDRPTSLSIALWPHVALPHGFVFVLGISLFALTLIDVIAP